MWIKAGEELWYGVGGTVGGDKGSEVAGRACQALVWLMFEFLSHSVF